MERKYYIIKIQKEKNMQKFTQIEIIVVNSGGEANTYLRQWQLNYPNRHIVNISVAPNDINYFLTIVYEMEV